MKVSFLITYYNQKEFVHESIQSVLNIKKENIEWEILVGDDGSTDGTIDEIEKYVRYDPKHIKLFVMPREEGKKYFSVQRASQNRLNLLSHATGDFFCTLDGDDFYCDSEFLMDAIDAFEQNPDVSIVGFGYRYYKDGSYGDSFTLPAGENERRVDTKAYLRAWYLPAGACVHRKCFGNDRIEYLRQISYFDDNDIVINSLCFGEMYAINRPIYAYRQTGTSVYTSMDQVEQAVLNVQGYDVDCAIAPQYQEDLLYRNAYNVLMIYFERKNLRRILGQKCEEYVRASKSLGDSLLLVLMQEDNASVGRQKYFFQRLLIRKPLTTIKTFIKTRKICNEL